MLNKLALAALAACIPLLPQVLADISKKPSMGFCKEGTCSDDEDGCPIKVATAGGVFPQCKLYTTEDVLVGDFEAAEGGGTEAFLNVGDPDPGCAYIVRSPASTEMPGCGDVVGAFRNPTCTKLALKKTFMLQHCCGSDQCEEAGIGAKMIRGMDYKARGLAGRGIEILDKDGNVIPPKEVGYPPQSKRSLPPAFSKREEKDEDKEENAKKGDGDDEDKKDEEEDKGPNHDNCVDYVPDGEVYTRPADAPQIIMTAVDGGTAGADVEITKERSVSQSISFSAGINIEIISVSTEITFEESITNGQSKKLPIPAGQVGKLAFTPILKCTKGALMCEGNESKGEACTGFSEGDDIAGTYTVIATS
ncbi:MAG: hypothetical protein Q9210_004419 [Variospora velana]